MQETQEGRGFNPWWGRSSGVQNGNPFQYPWLENYMDRGAWQATVHGVAKSWIWLSVHTHYLSVIHTHTNTPYFSVTQETHTHTSPIYQSSRGLTYTHTHIPYLSVIQETHTLTHTLFISHPGDSDHKVRPQAGLGETNMWFPPRLQSCSYSLPPSPFSFSVVRRTCEWEDEKPLLIKSTPPLQHPPWQLMSRAQTFSL